MHDRQLERLTRIFTAILSPLSLGCGIDQAQFSENLCDGELEALSLVEPASPVDYVELRRSNPIGVSMPEPTADVLDSVGERCGGASDVAACETAFAALVLESEIFDDSFSYVDNGYAYGGDLSLGFTRGDEVGSVNDLEDLLAFLGDIDAPGDAALLLDLSGREIVCNGENDVGERDGGFVIHTTSGGGCGSERREQAILVKPDGSFETLDSVRVERADDSCVSGRLPAGTCTRRVVPVADPVGSFFAGMASLEAASVTAFGQLAQELALHGAPRAMIRTALRSRRDEIRHARAMGWLARRHGGRPTAPRVTAWAPRGFAEVVADNAIEGCVRETYGALVAHLQARRARDPVVRRVLGRIAVDETRHAALSWNLAAWARERMSASERQRVARVGRAALDRMQVELTTPQAPEVHAATGLPEPELASALFGRLRRELLAMA